MLRIEVTRDQVQLATDYIGYKPDKRLARTHGRKKKWEIGHLWEIHHEIIRRVSLGDKNTDIAKELGVTDAMVSYTRNSKIALDKIDIMRGAMDADTIDLGRKIQQMAPRALQLMEEVIKGNGDGKEAAIGLRVKVAESVMDRAGYGAVKKIASMNAYLSPQDIERIKQRARESMSPMVVSNGEAGQEN